jgi:polysaccharide biosynthesis transport protein
MTQPQSTITYSPVSVVRMIGKQITKILVFSVLFTAATAIVVYLLPDIYRAESLILVEQQKIPEKLVESTVQIELQDRLATISQQILSATQLQKIIEKHNAYKDDRVRATPEELVDRMRRDIEIRTEKGWSRNRPGAFRVFFKGPDPQQAASIANEIANLFIEENVKSREVQATGASEFLGSQLEDARRRLLEQEAKLSEFKRRNSGQLPGQENSIIMTLANLQTRAQANNESINRSRVNKDMLETELRAAESTLQRVAAASLADAQAAAQAQKAKAEGATNGAGGPAAPKPRTRSEELEAALEAARRRYTDQHPQVRAIRTELDRARQIEAREKERELALQRQNPPAPAKPAANAANSEPEAPRISAQSAVMLESQRERVEKLKTQITATNQEIAAREEEKGRIDQELAKYQDVLMKLPVHEQEMIQVTRDYEVSKRNYDTLLQKSYTANTAEDLERRQKSERFTVLDTARAPEKPFQPNRPLLYAGGAFASVILALFAGIAFEFRKNVVLGEWELPPDVWLLGRIPVIHSESEEGAPASAPGDGKSSRRASKPPTLLQAPQGD